MKTGINKALGRDHESRVIVNGFTINGFVWRQHDPNDLGTARLEVVYSLTVINPDATVSISPLPDQCGIKIALYNVGDDKRLTRWLEESGDRADLLDWNYHDIERLVEADIAERFGYTV